MENKVKYLHKLYPTTKLIGVLVLAFICVISPHWRYPYFMFLLLCVLAVTGSNLKDYLTTLVKTVMVFFLIIFALQSFLRPGGEVIAQFWIFSIKYDGVMFALRLCGILLAVASSFVLYFQTTPIADLILALEKAGVSPTVSYVILSSMQMIPQTKSKLNVILSAQQARGIETKGNIFIRIKAFLPMLAPLVLSSFSGMEERALTLEARAFSASTKKTNIKNIHKTKGDQTIRVTLIVILAAAIIGRFTIWHS